MEGNNQKSIRIHKGFWTRDQVARDVDSIYVFGDNSEDAISCYVPSSTQACIRSLPNSIGITTKKNRGWDDSSFFNDRDLDEFKCIVEEAIDKVKNLQNEITIRILLENNMITKIWT